MTPEELANQIRTWGVWQGPEWPLDELVRRLSLAERALERIRDERERVPVKKTTGVSGQARYVHEVRSRVIAERALRGEEV